MRKILMIAGPNGAGKTTLAKSLIFKSPLIYEYINADDIAKGLAPLHPESVNLTASKLMIQRIKDLLGLNKSFAFETTAAGKNYVKHLKSAQKQGYECHLIFLWLTSPEQALRRVEERVKQGGHNIPKEIVVRRYYLGIKNLISCYLPIADTAFIIDNSSENPLKNIVAIKHKNKGVEILNTSLWEKIETNAKIR